jgi:O-acetyl-ADP-ribose deacetylase (regulator of RNase III)
MLRFVNGDMFKSKAQTLVNAVNCVGVMGKGIALTFKERFPKMFEDYQLQCQQGRIKPGVLTLYSNGTPWIINFPTKQHWKGKSQLEYIESGLQALVRQYKQWNLTSIAMPALGCGYGGLNWEDVRPLMEKYLSDVDMDIEVYAPGGISEPPKENEPYYSLDLFGNPLSNSEPKKKQKRRKKKSM